MKDLRTPYGKCTGCRRGAGDGSTHQAGTVEHPQGIRCLRSWPGAVCHGTLQPHPEVKNIWKCEVCESLYTESVLNELKS